MTIVLSDIRRQRTGSELETSVAIRIGEERRRFMIRHGGAVDSLEDIAPDFDPFLAVLLIPAMMRKAPIVVEGSIDARRLEALRTGVQTMLSAASDDWCKVPIEAEARTEDRLPDLSKGAALGMSCGIDSLFAFQDLARPEIAPHMRVKLLIHNDVGAHPDRGTFERHLAHVRRFADETCLPLVTTTIDLSGYYSRTFIHGHPLRNAAAAMSFEPLFHSYVYAKGCTGVQQARIGRNAGLGPMDPALLPQLNTSANAYISHGMHMERLEKTESVMKNDLARRYLTVCTHGFSDGRSKMNCGRCYKCARALFYAEANGRLSELSETFDIDAFRENRTHGLLRLLRHSVFNRKTRDDRDALAYLYEKGYSMPAGLWLFRRKVGPSSLSRIRRATMV